MKWPYLPLLTSACFGVTTLTDVSAAEPGLIAADTYSFEGFAGTRAVFFADGRPSTAAFWFPEAVLAAEDGTLFVADRANSAIRRITPTGNVSTWVGGPWSVAGAVGSPSGLAWDPEGNMLVVSWNAVRVVAPDRSVSILAGGGDLGHADGVGETAQFRMPVGIAVAPSGDVFVADSDNFVIRKIEPGGLVSTLVGSPGESGNRDGAGAAARFGRPAGLVIDSAGNLFVGDEINHSIRKVSPSGSVTTFATDVGFAAGLAIDESDTLYAVSGASNLIWEFDPKGERTLVAGTLDPVYEYAPDRYVTRGDSAGWFDGPGEEAQFNSPHGITLTPNGTLYVTDLLGYTIRKIAPDRTVTTVAGRPGGMGHRDGTGEDAWLNWPKGMAVDRDGNIFVVDRDNHCIRRITPDGVVTTVAGVPGKSGLANGPGDQALFFEPEDIDVDRDGALYVADSGNGAIRKIDPTGVVSTLTSPVTGYRDGPAIEARFRWPRSLAVDAEGSIFVADTRNYVVRRISVDGNVSTVAGRAGARGHVDGSAAEARFTALSGIAVDGDGVIYVCDSSNHSVRKITPDGIVSTLAGTGDWGAVDGPGSEALLHNPDAIALDATGNVYVTSDRLIRRISPTGDVTTVNGASLIDGEFAEWGELGGLAIDQAGNLYVADTQHGRIIRGRLSAGGPLSNLSVRARAGSGSETLIVGFVIPGADPASVLIRGVSQQLAEAPFDLTDTAGDVAVELVAGGAMIASNEDWEDAGDLVETFNRVGAFPLEQGSTDAALLREVSPGLYTAKLAVRSGQSGVALAEIYDLEPSAARVNRLINLSARTRVGTGDDALIAGFAIAEGAPRSVLIRAIGPGLGEPPFHVSGVLDDPKLELYNDEGEKVLENDDWSGAPELVAAFEQVGAFPLSDGQSKDAAFLARLEPGQYSAVVTGVERETGIALIEVYEIPTRKAVGAGPL